MRESSAIEEHCIALLEAFLLVSAGCCIAVAMGFKMLAGHIEVCKRRRTKSDEDQ